MTKYDKTCGSILQVSKTIVIIQEDSLGLPYQIIRGEIPESIDNQPLYKQVPGILQSLTQQSLVDQS